MANDKLQRIQALQSRMPIMNEEAAAKIQAGKGFAVQQAAQAIPQGANAARAAQSLSPQIASQAGTAQLQQNAQAQQQAMQTGQMALDITGQEAQQGLAKQELAQQQQLEQQRLQQQGALAREELSSKKTLSNEEIASAKRLSNIGLETDNRVSFLSRKQKEDLSKLGLDVKQKIYDNRIRFERDELGRKFSNERQMADYAIASAKNEQDLRNKMQIMQQIMQKELYMMEQASNKVNIALERGYLDDKRKLDQEQKRKLYDMKKKMDGEIRKKKANNAMIVNGLTAAGAVFFGGVGATGGAAAGSALGAVITA